MIASIKDRHHGPSDAMHNPPQPFELLSKETYLICHGDTHVIYWHLTQRLLILKRVILLSIHRDDGNPSSVNIKQHCDVLVMRTCKHGESNTSVLEDPTLQAGNPVKEVLPN
ncbi:hypothetical protein Tco_1105910 [Tanacetum coccineum]